MRKKTKYKYKFDELIFNNRWKQPIWNRSGTWVILGFGTRYFSPTEVEFYFNFFGFDFRFWFNREIKNKK